MADEVKQELREMLLGKDTPENKREEWMKDKKVWLCPPDCQFLAGEDGCVNIYAPDNPYDVFEPEGDYPLCPQYIKSDGQS